MPDTTIAVTGDVFRFDVDQLVRSARERWPDATFAPASPRMATVSLGQLQLPDAGSFPHHVLVDVAADGNAVDVSSPVDRLAADVIAWLLSLPEFPQDGSAFLVDWAAEPDHLPVVGSMSRQRLMELRG